MKLEKRTFSSLVSGRVSLQIFCAGKLFLCVMLTLAQWKENPRYQDLPIKWKGLDEI
jgi:hypothetical protein